VQPVQSGFGPFFSGCYLLGWIAQAAIRPNTARKQIISAVN
jgi:hypothetical protein